MAPSLIKQKGFSIVEIVLAIAVFTLFSGGIFYLSINTIQRDSRIELDTAALLYAQEGLEATRNIRDRDFLALTNGDHGLALINNTWVFVAAPESIDNFYFRTVTIEDVYRDENYNIVEEGGTLDSDTKLITSEVSWNFKGIFPRSIKLTTYLSNWTGDDYIQTTCTEFNLGIFDGTLAANTNAPPNDNCAIELDIVESASTFFSSVDLGHHTNDVSVEGNYAFLASDDMHNGFAVADVSDPANPSIVKELDIVDKGKFIITEPNYAYLGVAETPGGLVIVDITDPLTATVLSYTDVKGYGNNMAIKNDHLYMGVERTDKGFAAVNIADHSNPSYITYLNFGDKGHTVAIHGNYAYVGIEDDHLGFRVVDISNPNLPVLVSSLDVDEEVNAILISYPFAFVGTEESDNSLQVVNIADPIHPTILTSLNVNDEIEDMVISGDYIYAAIDDENRGLAAINISDPTNPTLAYNLDIQGKGKGIDSDGNYIYISTDTRNKGLVIVGTTISGVETSGTYISQAFDTGSDDTRYNFIEWDHIEIPGGSIKFQLRTADTLEGLDVATWVGSDGTGNTFYENSRTLITLDPNRSGQRYFQFKAYLDSDGLSTPSLESVRINYNP